MIICDCRRFVNHDMYFIFGSFFKICLLNFTFHMQRTWGILNAESMKGLFSRD